MKIDSIAIIGAGPGGIAALYEFLNTDKNGNSTVGTSRSNEGAFSKIVAFEQKSRPGGVWASDFEQQGPLFPSQELLNTGAYNDPSVLHPKRAIPESLEGTTFQLPLSTNEDISLKELEWSTSGVFSDLFTNVPWRFTRFSYIPNEEKYYDESRRIYPFVSQQELTKSLDDFIDKERLVDYIRVNSKVESLEKNSKGKWVLTVRKLLKKGEYHWYQEEFDGVVVAIGHYSLPNIPHIPGLAQQNELHPGSLMHAKSFRNAEIFKNQKVVLVGSSISTTNLVQYIVPLAKKVIISRRSVNKIYPWINDALSSEGIVSKPTISKIVPEKNEIIFSDGSVEKNVDKIVFTTGYHFHFPFLEDKLKVHSPSNSSRVSGLYYNTFSIDDPSLAAVGITVSPLTFHTIEASAAAIAGVWSGAKELPSKEKQREWELSRVKTHGDNLQFHFYPYDNVKEEFVDKVHKFSPHNRKSALDIDGQYVNDIPEGTKRLEQIFHKLKSGEYKVEDTLYPVSNPNRV
ncbi:uncharacterized protein PRCAT00005214001 [Priceomyces carsonii]|uniref:uncharacterized protein n=1 Tax=Priceomyces carsonii TaxID=28549 RepID=UPI002EDA8615|nr:unnamed protein product [Priceomyces carsonii]